nr:MAG: tail fiber protein [Bacteriophage sp.]
MVKYTADGVSDQYEFNFPGGYLNKSDIKAFMFVAEGAVRTDLTVSFVSSNVVALTPAQPEGAEVTIYRDTPKEVPLVSFTDGAMIEARNLDRNAKQCIFAVAEILDKYNIVYSQIELAEMYAVAAANSASEAAAQAVYVRAIYDRFKLSDDMLLQMQGYRDASAASAISAELSAESSEQARILAEAARDATQAVAEYNGTYSSAAEGLAATTEGQFFRVPQGVGALYSFKYYKNSAGVAVEVARQLGDGAVEYVLRGVYPAATAPEATVVAGSAMSAQGVVSESSDWDAYYIPVKRGDEVVYFGNIDTATVGQVVYWLIQCTPSKSYSKSLTRTVSTGNATLQGTVKATAVSDGFMYVRVRKVGNPGFSFQVNSRALQTQADATLQLYKLSKGQVQNDPASVWEIVKNIVVFPDGTSGTYADWDAYYVPVKAGDSLKYFGVINTGTPGTLNHWIIQCDADKAPVSSLASTASTGTPTQQGVVEATAISDGYLYVRVRNALNPAFYMEGYSLKLISTESVGVSGGVAEFDMVTALANNGESKDYTEQSTYFDVGTVILEDGTVNNAAGNQWYAYYIPVAAGDTVTMQGIYGSATSGQSMGYFIQLDSEKNFVETLGRYVSTGVSDVVRTQTATASRDGLMYVRVRKLYNGQVQDYSVSGFHKHYELLQVVAKLQSDVQALESREVSQVPIITSTLERLPVKFDNQLNYNGAAFLQDNLVVAGNYTYITGVMVGKKPGIHRKNNTTGVWDFFDLSTVAGNPLASPTAADSHNVYAVGVTRDGYVLVSGNMHVNPCRAVISTQPWAINAWEPITYTDSPSVTYPRFIKYPDGTTQAFWRQGTSSAGQYFAAIFNDETRTFGTPQLILATDLTVNAYEQRLGVGADGALHLCWGYRTASGGADSNYGLFYARSLSKGERWSSADRSVSFTPPLTEQNSEKIADIKLNTGYVNQCGGATDRSGRYHTAVWQNDSDGNTQIQHIWFTGSEWKSETVSKFDFKMNTSGGLLRGDLSRPLVGCTRYGKTYILYKTTEMGRTGQIRAIDVTVPGSPKEYILAGFNVGTQEISLNTHLLLEENSLQMLVSQGAVGYADADYQRYIGEVGYVLRASLI